MSKATDAALRRAFGHAPKPRKRLVVPEATRTAIKEAREMVKNQDVPLYYRGFLIRRSPFGHGFIPERGGFKYTPKPTLADAKKDVDDIEG